MENDMQHSPVLLAEVLECLQPQRGGTYVDCTFGAGGYSSAILQSNNDTKVIALDRDASVAQFATPLLKRFPQRFTFYHSSYDVLQERLGDNKVQGIVYDLGVSSMQIDQSDRGFSFQKDGPLDMRMDQGQHFSAYTVVNEYSEAELARIIREYGDERKARLIAKAIVASRKVGPISSTMALSEVVKKTTHSYKDTINPATRTFQAIRIEVNGELQQLKRSLQQAKSLLDVGGRMVVVSFHSGEDKIVKDLFHTWCGKKSNINRYLPEVVATCTTPEFKPLHKGIVIAGIAEVDGNPRARSAKLRAIERMI